MAFGDNGAVDFVKPAMYLINELHPLYTKVAQAEHSVYKGLFGKKSKAQKAIDMYDKILSRAVEPLCEITEGIGKQQKQGKDYAESVLALYKAFIAINESRILVLREFIANGMSNKTYSLNQRSLDLCSAYDALFKPVQEETDSLYNIFNMMGLFDILE